MHVIEVITGYAPLVHDGICIGDVVWICSRRRTYQQHRDGELPMSFCLTTNRERDVGKTHAMAIGLTKMSSEQIRAVNKGVAVDTQHFLMDGLWQTQSL
jgi:hypothetical protein